MSIKTTRTVTTIDGKTVELTEGGPQVWAIELSIDDVNVGSGCAGNDHTSKVFHCMREPLERAGLLPAIDIPKEEHGVETPEDLAIRLLESLGVVFE